MRYSLAVLIALLSFIATASAAPIAGQYSDGSLTVDLNQSDNSITGTLTLNGHQYPATAHTTAAGADGSFTAGGNAFPFSITLAGETMTLTTGSKTYTLKHAGQPANPLDANPLDGKPVGAGLTAAPDVSLPPNYTTITSTSAGKCLATQKPNSDSVQAALQSTLTDLAKYFSAKITIGHAYQSVNNQNAGGATFTSAQNNQPIRGVISCTVDDKHTASISVIFCRADASNAEWNKLANPTSAAAPSDAAPAAPLSEADMDARAAAATKILGDSAKVYKFPDGTGSITIADGWSTSASSAIDPIYIKGPADQTAFIGATVQVHTHDSPFVKMIQQTDDMRQKNNASMKRMNPNYNPPAPPPKPLMFIAELSDPVQALTDINQQLNDYNKSKNLPSGHIDQILSHKDQPSPNPQWKIALIEYLVTRTTDGKDQPRHAIENITLMPGIAGSGAWTYLSNGCSTPAATWDQDRPIVISMFQTLKLDNAAIAQVSQQRMQQMAQQSQQNSAMLKQQADAQNAQLTAQHNQFMQDQQTRFDIGQQQHQAQMDGYAQHNAQFQNDQLNKSRNKDNVVESILGQRTVYDTQTGQSTKVDLNSASAIVDQMNQDALDPHRFVQIPLRDEQDPR